MENAIETLHAALMKFMMIKTFEFVAKDGVVCLADRHHRASTRAMQLQIMTRKDP